MKSEWKVTSNTINGKPMYRCFRILDTEKPVHSGNVEYASEYVSDYQVALDTVALCNELENER
jgi:hypothetical protein